MTEWPAVPTLSGSGERLQLGTVHPAEFDRVWFIRVPSFACWAESETRNVDTETVPAPEDNNNTDINKLSDTEECTQELTETQSSVSNEESDLTNKEKNKKSKLWKSCEIL